MTTSNNVVSNSNLRKIRRKETVFCKARFQNSLEEERPTPQIPNLGELFLVLVEDQMTDINEKKHNICSTWGLK